VPDAIFRLALLRHPASDRATLADPRNFAIIFGGMRRSWASCRDGVHDDAILYAAPWSFDPAQIRTPVEFWHGEEDINFPPALARKLCERIPCAQIHVVPGEGHYSLPVNHTDAIVSALGRQAR
jgi:pimeloyl-ACP methyl ester carboxylesterase